MRPPAVGVALAVVPFLAILAGVCYDWWRYPKPAVVLLEPATVCFALLCLAVVGVFWIVRSYGFWKREQRLSWRMGLAPLVVVATVLVFFTVQTPTDRAFDRAHPEMAELADSMLRDGTQHLGPTEINGYEFSTVFIREDNCVYFVDSRRSAITIVGWLYTANCTPNLDRFRRLKPVAENWFSFEQGT
ncbi:hypothetical protein NOU13_31990 [Rhodococcus erythropolis]|uniref:hypothetical protein n=1 Tax=Rhodococcus erythropolis TaxID=1833 RepID=UPI00210DEF65|nr:hypothetical protein [Rhodococcus erythropolis]MCQ4129128.1 hypothetical protein [Rhodococcus erythropolis]